MDKNTALEYSFIGSGWAFRNESGIGVNGQGNIALMHGEMDVAKSIFIILSTAPGERVMRPEFGCGVHSLVFSVPGPQLFGLIAYNVTRALGRWEPRIDVTEVTANVDPVAHERIMVNISYTLRANNSNRNLVWPFYLIPRGED